MSIDSNKVYYAYTEHVDVQYFSDVMHISPSTVAELIDKTRATIAMKLEGNTIKYGVSVCSNGDNFNRELGRKLAEERLNAGYCSFVISGKLYNQFKDNHEMSLYFLNNITNSTQMNLRKVQQKIGAWNKEKRKEQKLLGHDRI